MKEEKITIRPDRDAARARLPGLAGARLGDRAQA
ncbi:hypothetical protein P3T27_007880 [Kitasatospora sp. MAA19]|nr:hypothetical protein [Kitasatospora sp. MAA19]